MLPFVGADSEASTFSGEYIQPYSPILLKPRKLSAAPHASFRLSKGAGSLPRESIDIRALVFFADVEYPTVGSWARIKDVDYIESAAGEEGFAK